jgi:hypothetical protein
MNAQDRDIGAALIRTFFLEEKLGGTLNPDSETAQAPSARQRRSQKDAILRLLLSARGEWVPLWQITPLAAQYNARIFSLRHEDGFAIESRAERDPSTGVVHSWFRLPGPVDQIPATPPPATAGPERSPFARAHAEDEEREANRLPLFAGVR